MIRHRPLLIVLLLLTLLATASAAPIWTHNASDRVTGVAISMDAGTIALSADHLRLLDRTGAERGNTWPVDALAVSKDGSRVAVGSAEGVRLLDRNGTELWSRGPGPATAVAISQDGKVVAAGTGQGALQVFNATGGLVGSAILDKKVQGSVVGVAIDNSGSTVAVVDERASFIYSRAGKLLGRNERWTPLSVAIAGNGTVAMIGQAGGVAFVRGNGTLRNEVRTGTRVTSVAISRGGDLAASGDEAGMLAAYGTGGTQLWNMTAPGRVTGVGVSENGTRAGAAWTDRSLRVLDANGTVLATETLSGTPTAFAFSADGRYLVVGCQDGTTALFPAGGPGAPRPTATTANATRARASSSLNATTVPAPAGNLTAIAGTAATNRTPSPPNGSISSPVTGISALPGENSSGQVTATASPLVPATNETLGIATLETLPRPAGAMPLTACMIALGAICAMYRLRIR